MSLRVAPASLFTGANTLGIPPALKELRLAENTLRFCLGPAGKRLASVYLQPVRKEASQAVETANEASRFVAF